MSGGLRFRIANLSAGAIIACLIAFVVSGALSGGIVTVVKASYSTQQFGFDDDAYATYSIYVVCTRNSGMSGCSNQNGQDAYQCFNTPWTFTHDYNWWWVGTPDVYQYKQTGCAGGYFAHENLAISGFGTTPWYCYSTYNGGYTC